MQSEMRTCEVSSVVFSCVVAAKWIGQALEMCRWMFLAESLVRLDSESFVRFHS